MTPSFMLGYSGAFNLYSTGWMTGAGTIASNMGYRPVINISSKVYVLSGNGEKDETVVETEENINKKKNCSLQHKAKTTKNNIDIL